MKNNSLLRPDELNQLKSIKLSKPDDDVYVLTEPLKEAVKVAFMLNQPLLLTGDPGTGKTTLANKVARELHHADNTFFPEPLFFSTKSTTVANDLFYVYDAISHFYDANIAKNDTQQKTARSVTDYISLSALGKAILASNRDQLKSQVLLDQLPQSSNGSPTPINFVVLIDEIDKAPRDFPNDILHEIETYSFKIKESGNTSFKKNDASKIFVIMTSNSERALPDAFLRRCIFFNIEFPDHTKLVEILSSHAISDGLAGISSKFKDNAVSLFEKIHDVCIDKKPTTAELINWAAYLHGKKFDFDRRDPAILESSLGIVAKSKNDQKLIRNSGLLS